jgi:ElaB/YqjD/DUF883 family membrane-anchored ribosome-binding protein
MTTETTALQDTGDSRRSGFVNDVKHAAGRADELMTDAANTTAEGYAAARASLHEAMGEARVAADVTQTYVKENPWQVLGGAAVAGFLIGFLMSRR